MCAVLDLVTHNCVPMLIAITCATHDTPLAALLFWAQNDLGPQA